MGILGYLAIWLVLGLIHGVYLHITSAKFGTETLFDDLFMIAFATVFGPVGIVITVVQLLTEPRV